MVNLDGIQVGNKVDAIVRNHRGNGYRHVRGEVTAVYTLTDGHVSFIAVVTGASANRSKRYVDRHTAVEITTSPSGR